MRAHTSSQESIPRMRHAARIEQRGLFAYMMGLALGQTQVVQKKPRETGQISFPAKHCDTLVRKNKESESAVHVDEIHNVGVPCQQPQIHTQRREQLAAMARSI